MLFAQVAPGLNEAIQSAVGQDRGWEAVVLICLIFGGFGFFAFMFRQFSEQAKIREERLAARVTHLEDTMRDKLFSIIDQTATMMSKIMEQTDRLYVMCDRIETTMDKFHTVLDNRPCMAMEAVERAKLVDLLVQHADGKRAEGEA